jgi:hypothetical protein
VHFEVNAAVQRFANYVGVPLLQDGTPWRFTSHQFRTFFAVMYYHRFEMGSLTALSHFLRHNDPSMTRRYVTRPLKGYFAELIDDRYAATQKQSVVDKAIFYAEQRNADFSAAGAAFRLTKYKSIGGFGGDALKRDLLSLVKQWEQVIEIEGQADGIGDDVRLDMLLENFVRDKYLDPHPQGHSYCKCSSEPLDLAAAACLQGNPARDRSETPRPTAPDYGQASDETCSRCPHNVAFTENKAYWLEQHAQASEQAARGTREHLRMAGARRATKLREHIKRCFEDASSLTNSPKGSKSSDE